MPKPVLIVINESHEVGGILELMLRERGIPFENVDLNAGDVIPPVKNYSAMIVMGGTDSANDETPKMKTELQRAKEAIDAKLPYFGVCLGLQVLVKAAGGKVRKNDVREVAFRDQEGKFFTAELTEAGKKDPIMKGLPDVLPMFHLHGETVELAPKMTLLASGEWCVNQIVRVAPKMYGMQGHLELTDEMFMDWREKNDWLRDSDQQALDADWPARKEELQKTLRLLFGNFLDIAGL